MEDKKYFCTDCNSEMNKGEASVFTVCDRCWNKHYNNPHPSDSDIDEASIEFAEKENTNGHDDYIRIMNVYSEGMKAMRDRMNGEMAEYKELVFRLAEWSKKYPRGRIYGASRQEGMDGELIEMEEAAKTILQKFRSR